MSKVLVDRELLERTAAHLEWDGSEPMTTIQFSQKCDVLADELRRSIAQPAEAEGVEVVGWRIGFPNGSGYKLYEQRQDWAYEGYGSISYEVQDLMTVAQHERTLSAVTAERDRLRKDAERYRWASSGVHEAETLVSIVNCHGGYAEKVAERVDVYREAAMAAKEA